MSLDDARHYKTFQSTPPVREATCSRFNVSLVEYVSIHASREGGDSNIWRANVNPCQILVFVFVIYFKIPIKVVLIENYAVFKVQFSCEPARVSLFAYGSQIIFRRLRVLPNRDWLLRQHAPRACANHRPDNNNAGCPFPGRSVFPN